jgi:alkaline phosphatase
MNKQGKGSPKKTVTVLFLLLAGIMLAAVFAAPAVAARKPIAKNIIVLIADGRGFNHVEATDYYVYKNNAGQVYTRFPFRAAMSTYMDYKKTEPADPCDGQGYDPALAWSEFDYVKSCYTDSAAAATAMSTGVKSYNGAIGVDLDEKPLTHILEMAEAKGKATGVITSVEWTHATPAGHVAHNVSRNNYAEIGVEMVYESAADVIMGAGHPFYDADGQLRDTPITNQYQYVGGEATWNDLVAGIAGGDADGDGVADPWVLIQTREEFQALMRGKTPKRVLGTAQVYQTLQSDRGGDVDADPFVVPLTETVPTLEEMTRAALNILDNDPDGFFLMVEGGAVDWASHDNQSGRMIEEHMDFDNSVQAVVDWVQKKSNWGETLVIVTSDHETGYLTGPGSNPSWMPVVDYGQGVLPGMEWHSSDHTNSLVPFYAKGDGARLFKRFADQYDPVHGFYLDNTEMATGIMWAMK